MSFQRTSILFLKLTYEMYSYNGRSCSESDQYFQEMTCRHHPWKYWLSFINPSWKQRRFKHWERHMKLSTSDLLNCRAASKWALIWSQTDKLIQLWKQGHAAPVPYLHTADPNLCVFGNSWPIKRDAWRSSISIRYATKRIQQKKKKKNVCHGNWDSPAPSAPWKNISSAPIETVCISIFESCFQELNCCSIAE